MSVKRDFGNNSLETAFLVTLPVIFKINSKYIGKI